MGNWPHQKDQFLIRGWGFEPHHTSLHQPTSAIFQDLSKGREDWRLSSTRRALAPSIMPIQWNRIWYQDTWSSGELPLIEKIHCCARRVRFLDSTWRGLQKLVFETLPDSDSLCVSSIGCFLFIFFYYNKVIITSITLSVSSVTHHSELLNFTEGDPKFVICSELQVRAPWLVLHAWWAILQRSILNLWSLA